MEDYNKGADLHVESSSIGSSGSMSSSSSSSLEMADHDHDEEVSSRSQGPLYELSDLMAQLPIKRGLSKFYDGKSQSYKSLMSVRSIEDLLKKDERPYNNNKRLKIWSNGGSKKVFSPIATISKKQQKKKKKKKAS